MKCYIMDQYYPLRIGRKFDLLELKQKISFHTGISISRILKSKKCTDTGALEVLIIKIDYDKFLKIIYDKKISANFHCFSDFPYTGLRIDEKLLSF
jgi:hypothetical protein